MKLETPNCKKITCLDGASSKIIKLVKLNITGSLTMLSNQTLLYVTLFRTRIMLEITLTRGITTSQLKPVAYCR